MIISFYLVLYCKFLQIIPVFTYAYNNIMGIYIILTQSGN